MALLLQCFLGDLTEIVGSLDLEVALLHEGAVENRAELTGGGQRRFLHENNAVFLLLEYGESVGRVGGSYDHFKENLVDFFGGSGVDLAVGDEHSAES